MLNFAFSSAGSLRSCLSLLNPSVRFIMKAFAALAALLVPLTEAHYIFNRLIVNGANVGGEYAYT